MDDRSIRVIFSLNITTGRQVSTGTCYVNGFACVGMVLSAHYQCRSLTSVIAGVFSVKIGNSSLTRIRV
jgi:hypothetical protein